MIDLVANKASSGDVYVVKGRMHLERHEWGMAFRSIEMALLKGNLSDESDAIAIYREICERMDVAPHLSR